MPGGSLRCEGRHRRFGAVLGAVAVAAALVPGVVLSAPAASAGGTAGLITNYPGTGIDTAWLREQLDMPSDLAG